MSKDWAAAFELGLGAMKKLHAENKRLRFENGVLSNEVTLLRAKLTEQDAAAAVTYECREDGGN